MMIALRLLIIQMKIVFAAFRLINLSSYTDPDFIRSKCQAQLMLMIQLCLTLMCLMNKKELFKPEPSSRAVPYFF